MCSLIFQLAATLGLWNSAVISKCERAVYILIHKTFGCGCLFLLGAEESEGKILIEKLLHSGP